MAIRINDNRLGVRNLKRKVTQWPTHFATGEVWNRMGNPTPTTVNFGPDARYFYVLPIGRAAAPLALREEFERSVEENERPQEILAPEAVVASPPSPTANAVANTVQVTTEAVIEPVDSVVVKQDEVKKLKPKTPKPVKDSE